MSPGRHRLVSAHPTRRLWRPPDDCRTGRRSGRRRPVPKRHRVPDDGLPRRRDDGRHVARSLSFVVGTGQSVPPPPLAFSPSVVASFSPVKEALHRPSYPPPSSNLIGLDSFHLAGLSSVRDGRRGTVWADQVGRIEPVASWRELMHRAVASKVPQATDAKGQDGPVVILHLLARASKGAAATRTAETGA